LVSIIHLHIKRPLIIGWRFSLREWFDLVKEGLPMFIAGYGATIGWTLATTTLIWKYLGIGILGSFSMAFMVLEAANKVPQALSAVYAPRIIEEFGRTGEIAACLQICRKPMLWGTPAMLGLACFGSIALHWVVPILMPKYVGAIPSMCLMLLFLPLYVLEIPYSLLVAMGSVMAQNVVTYTGLGVFAVIALIAIQGSYGLNGVIIASLLGYLVRLVLVYSYLNWTKRKHVRMAR
jgi:O-antigen/teichoic acid export membrane protein